MASGSGDWLGSLMRMERREVVVPRGEEREQADRDEARHDRGHMIRRRMASVSRNSAFLPRKSKRAKDYPPRVTR